MPLGIYSSVWPLWFLDRISTSNNKEIFCVGRFDTWQEIEHCYFMRLRSNVVEYNSAIFSDHRSEDVYIDNTGLQAKGKVRYCPCRYHGSYDYSAERMVVNERSFTKPCKLLCLDLKGRKVLAAISLTFRRSKSSTSIIYIVTSY